MTELVGVPQSPEPCSECDALRAEILRLRAALEAANMKVKQAALLFSWHYYAPSPAVYLALLRLLLGWLTYLGARVR